MATEIEVVHRNRKGEAKVDDGVRYIHPYRYFQGYREEQPKPQLPQTDTCENVQSVCPPNTLIADW